MAAGHTETATANPRTVPEAGGSNPRGGGRVGVFTRCKRAWSNQYVMFLANCFGGFLEP